MEAIRIIKEMRESGRANGRTNEFGDVFPRFAIWENVAGAFSSNRGEDFRCVLEEFCNIEGKNVVIPKPKNGKWDKAGIIIGDGFSVAWRLFDAQYWGVPQRRKRIAVVGDFAGGSAGEILFEREGLRRNLEESEQEREGTSRSVGESSNGTDRAFTLKIRGGGQTPT
jgi:DNA (cytosine-5)-methyltransferase 1